MSELIRKIAFVDAGRRPRLLERLLEFVRADYTFQFVEPQKADFVFHSCMGEKVLSCQGVRIFITGECVTPDFNVSDYAFGFDHLEYGDRYHRLPLYRLCDEAWNALVATRPEPDLVLAQKKHFCAYVMSNTKDSAFERTEIVEALERYKPVDCGGKWRNNVGGPVEDKIEFQRSRKFVIAFENYSYPGYLTEKFAQAAQSNAIPIYWGDPTVAEQLNPASFINAHDFSTLDELADHVAEVDQDNQLYMRMLSEPWFTGPVPQSLDESVIRDWLRSILDQPVSSAYRRNQGRWGQKVVDRRLNPLLRRWKRLF
ncbi:MAG: glycosyltransferase family 10 [Planctomycetota bacterium]|jgi:hypothetical protein|nr:MAG: glycosyltransferase [Phycisphaeraceae bacterium]|tara:strand:+ start:170 stop:1108 length:939 start_codon:yes stop_codon:yes gene_type:complete